MCIYSEDARPAKGTLWHFERRYLTGEQKAAAHNGYWYHWSNPPLVLDLKSRSATLKSTLPVPESRGREISRAEEDS